MTDRGFASFRRRGASPAGFVLSNICLNRRRARPRAWLPRHPARGRSRDRGDASVASSKIRMVVAAAMAYLTILLDGTAYGMILFIISVGLTVTMGLDARRQSGARRLRDDRRLSGGDDGCSAACRFFAAAVLAALAVGVLGAVAELTLYRPLYRRGELPQALMTFGFTFVVIAALTLIFGASAQALPVPRFLAGLTRSRLHPISDLSPVPDRDRRRDGADPVGDHRPHALWRAAARGGRQSAHGARHRHGRESAVHRDLRGRLRAGRVRRRHRRRHAAGRALLRAALSRDFPGRGGGRRHRQFQGLASSPRWRSASSKPSASSCCRAPRPTSSMLLVLVLLLWRPHGLLPAKSAP